MDSNHRSSVLASRFMLLNVEIVAIVNRFFIVCVDYVGAQHATNLVVVVVFIKHFLPK